MDQSSPVPEMCQRQAHLIQGDFLGAYSCVYCGAMFREHHMLMVQAGVDTNVVIPHRPPPPLPPVPPANER